MLHNSNSDLIQSGIIDVDEMIQAEIQYDFMKLVKDSLSSMLIRIDENELFLFESYFEKSSILRFRG